MAKELSHAGTPSQTGVYALLLRRGEVWSTVAAAWVTPVVADWANYDIPLTETPAASGVYVANAPAAWTTALTCEVQVRLQIGAAPAPDDTLLGLGKLAWDGTAEVETSDLATPADIDQEVGRRNGANLAWFVDTEDGDDGNDGLSWAGAKATLGGAAAEGDFGLPGTTQIVYVAGEPAEAVDFVDGITLQAMGAIWRYTAAVYNLRLGKGGACRGFVLERAAAAGEIVTATDDCVIEDCTLEATGGCKAVLGVANCVITLRRCVIRGNLDATAGTIVVDQCRRESGSDTGNVVFCSDEIASVEIDVQSVSIG